MASFPSSLYIHIPFCARICPYCDFTKLLYRGDWALSYILALRKEITKRCGRHKFRTIYIGGGTPTCLSDLLFEEMLSYVSPYLKKGGEFTIEANPESLTKEKIALMASFGVNRVSMGMQSSSKAILESMDRRHDFDTLTACVANLKEAGIHNISVDLIYALPNETNAEAQADLEALLSLDIPHCSCYSYIQEADSIWSRRGIKEASEDIQAEQYDIVEKTLTKAGYTHYEVSSYSKCGYQSKHNKTYWRDEEYVACGLGASGYVHGVRYKNVVGLPKYLRGEYTDTQEQVTPKDDYTYFLLTNLRLASGFTYSRFARKFGYRIEIAKSQELEKAADLGYVRLNDKGIKVASKGLKMLDSLILMMMD